MNEVSHSLDRLAMATERLLTTATALSDAQMRDPSLLPGWTRGHVLTHIARNADGLVNLMRWARTGTKTPMYARGGVGQRRGGREQAVGRLPDAGHRPAGLVIHAVLPWRPAAAVLLAGIRDHPRVRRGRLGGRPAVSGP